VILFWFSFLYCTSCLPSCNIFVCTCSWLIWLVSVVFTYQGSGSMIWQVTDIMIFLPHIPVLVHYDIKCLHESKWWRSVLIFKTCDANATCPNNFLLYHTFRSKKSNSNMLINNRSYWINFIFSPKLRCSYFWKGWLNLLPLHPRLPKNMVFLGAM
jgi:hypothetical protein